MKMNNSMPFLLILYLYILQLTSITIGEGLPSQRNIRGENFQREDDNLQHARIVGGREAIPGRYPYQVGLMFFFGSIPFCGGTLIHPEWVLTAGHCYGVAHKVQIGRHDITDPSEENFEEIGVLHQILHPKFDSSSMNFDYSLIQLKKSSKHSPIKLDDGCTDIKRTDFTILGWGTTSSGGKHSNVLKEVEVHYVPNSLCKLTYMLYPFERVQPTMVCARRPGSDACQGDSGGPLIIKGQNATEDIQVGIVSWGVGCANPLFPGVYARVSSAMDFIRDHVPI